MHWFALCATLAATGCGQSSTDGAPEAPGAIGFALQVSPGNDVSTATYTISGPNGFASFGTVQVGDSADVPVVVNHLPIGTGYELNVSGVADDGVTTCDGAATFDIGENTVGTIVVHLVCGVPSGDAVITGTLNICPVLDALSANPTALRLGGSAALITSAHDTDNGPAPLSYKWTANNVTLKPQTPSLTFTCNSAGDVTLGVAVSDGDPNPACSDNLSVVVHCSAP